MPKHFPVIGKGLGLRRSQMRSLEQHDLGTVDFMEVAPENWIDVGGHYGRRFKHFTESMPFVAHGLSLNLGGPAPLDEPFIRRIKQFLDQHHVRCYSEHLSYCGDDAHLYDLMPIPFTDESVLHVAERIKRTQDILERRMAVENASYYCSPGSQITELEFVRAVLEEADCDLLLDVNNVYVNSVNHGYDPVEYLHGLPGDRIAYAHIAGHYNEADDLIVDTHGADVIDPVWALLDEAYRHFGVFPTLLERDFNIPPLENLLDEVTKIGDIQSRYEQLDSIAVLESAK
ncbi:MAG: DUF692 domain-containing protein [Pseudomonadota bacterium]